MRGRDRRCCGGGGCCCCSCVASSDALCTWTSAAAAVTARPRARVADALPRGNPRRRGRAEGGWRGRRGEAKARGRELQIAGAVAGRVACGRVPTVGSEARKEEDQGGECVAPAALAGGESTGVRGRVNASVSGFSLEGYFSMLKGKMVHATQLSLTCGPKTRFYPTEQTAVARGQHNSVTQGDKTFSVAFEEYENFL